MSKTFKPVYTQVAEQLAAQLKAGTSPLQQPYDAAKDRASFIKPVNAFTGKGYSALNALNLGLKNFDSPLFMSFKDANFNKLKIKPGETGTAISFYKRSDIEAVRDAVGEKIKDGEGKTQTRTVEYENAQKNSSSLFNATQMKDSPELTALLNRETPPETLSPIDKAHKIIEDSGATIIHGGNEAYYDKARDAIFMPEMDMFKSETQYLQVAIHQLAHWTGHESRLDRPMEGKYGSLELGKEELRASIAAMLIGAETGLNHFFPHHHAYSSGWAKNLTDRPYEMAAIAQDAQKAVSMLLGYGQKREEKKTESQSKTLSKGESIPYNDTTYNVIGKKGNTLTIQKEDTGEKFKAKPEDKIYLNLVEARNNPAPQQKQEENQQQETENDMVAEVEHKNKIGR